MTVADFSPTPIALKRACQCVQTIIHHQGDYIRDDRSRKQSPNKQYHNPYLS